MAITGEKMTVLSANASTGNITALPWLANRPVRIQSKYQGSAALSVKVRLKNGHFAAHFPVKVALAQ